MSYTRMMTPLRSSRTMSGMMVPGLQVLGSELTGHSETRVEGLALWVELGRWEKALERAAFYRWPLSSLQEESCEPRARDEHAWMRAFAGKGALP